MPSIAAEKASESICSLCALPPRRLGVAQSGQEFKTLEGFRGSKGLSSSLATQFAIFSRGSSALDTTGLSKSYAYPTAKRNAREQARTETALRTQERLVARAPSTGSPSSLTGRFPQERNEQTLPVPHTTPIGISRRQGWLVALGPMPPIFVKVRNTASHSRSRADNGGYFGARLTATPNGS